MIAGADIETVVLVEGESDRQALLALAERHGRDLSTEAITVVEMGGITNLDKHVRDLGPLGRDLHLVGLYDIGEARHVANVVAANGLSPAEFFACDVDLEGELIRALGHDEMLAFIESQNETRPFRTLQKQLAQRERTLDQQLHRFCGIKAGRKVRYARGMVEWLDINRIPKPLDALLRAV